MAFLKKDKIKLLNYAIKRINEYDKFKKRTTRVDLEGLSICRGCVLSKIARENDKQADYSEIMCEYCPFSINPEDRCRPDSFYEKSTGYHQKRLIKALKDWCKKFLPEYEIEVIK